ncbi:hypothetical protein BG015_005089 [Linnemannia schmuckeri]|uniref:F-box domain-containing protein n=1 Tax=Linnemannia schmuckeri TaxID=64567 RepID=A0A9P5UXE3_9FUNG|nr:hypothetical protein BG015_005089 [Linnemannia schmuckeri]
MDSACSTFFGIPELVASLAHFLSKQDLIQLSRANRAINSVCSPLTWQSVNVESKHAIKLLNSPEALHAFGNNITSVRSITLRPKFSWYYLYTLWAYLNTTAWPPHRVILTDALAHKDWGGMLYAPCLKIRRLPPLLRLNRLEASLASVYKEKMMPDLPDYDYDKHVHQLLWLVRLNSGTLTHVTLTSLSLGTFKAVRDVCRTISRLHNLRFLRLSCMVTRQDYETLFLSCPSSLVELSLAYKVDGPGSVRVSVPVTGDWDFDQGPLVLRETPLHHLVYLVLPESSALDMAPVIRTIFGHSPALESIQLPRFDFYDIPSIIKAITEFCPHLSHMSFPQGGRDYKITGLLEGFPVQRLRSLNCSFLVDPDSKSMLATWTRHSTTMRRIECTNMRGFSSSIIKGALTTCEALETFKVTGSQGGIYLTLGDAVESEWVCKRLQVLDVIVLINANERSPKFTTDPSKETWTEDDHRKWEVLGKLYSQIGSLTELQVLDLQTVSHHYQPVPSSEAVFPGLFALEDLESGKIGHLSKLSGLTKLRVLRGSVRWTIPEVMERLGKREVDWFVDHLPALREATFILQNNNGMIGARPIRQLLRTLEKKRPELQFCRTVSKNPKK